MRVIKIDPYNQEVFNTEMSMTLDGIYEELNCDTFCIVNVDSNNSLYLDDCGLMKANSYFEYEGYPQMLAGYGLIVSHDEEGDALPPTITLEEAMARVSF